MKEARCRSPPWSASIYVKSREAAGAGGGGPLRGGCGPLRASLWGDEIIWKWTVGWLLNSENVLNDTVHFEMVHFMLCEIHLN